MTHSIESIVDRVFLVARAERRRAPRDRVLERGRAYDQMAAYLFDHVVAELRASGEGLPELDLWVIAALAQLGPEDCGPPPAAYLTLVRSWIHAADWAKDPAEQQRLVMDFCLAFGCGWRRPGSAEVDTWSGPPWANAVQDLVWICHDLLFHIRKALQNRVFLFDQDIVRAKHPEDQEMELWSDAALVALQMLEAPPEPAVKFHEKFQSLHQWEPKAEAPLPSWIRACLLGMPGAIPAVVEMPNAFERGLAYPLWADRGELTSAKVAFEQCVACRGEKREFHTASCPECRGSAKLYYARPRLVVPGKYGWREFWKCTNTEDSVKKHYFMIGPPDQGGGKTMTNELKSSAKVNMATKAADPAPPSGRICPAHLQAAIPPRSSWLAVKMEFAQSPVVFHDPFLDDPNYES